MGGIAGRVGEGGNDQEKANVSVFISKGLVLMEPFAVPFLLFNLQFTSCLWLERWM